MNHPGFGRPISYISPKTQDTHTDTRTNAGRNSTCVLAQHIADMEIISGTYHFIVMGSADPFAYRLEFEGRSHV